MISDNQLETYKTTGFIVVEDLIPKNLLNRIKSVVSHITQSAKGLEVHNEVFDFEDSHTPTEPRIRRIKMPHKLDKIFLELLRQPQMEAILTKILGPNVRLHGSKLNIKAPKYGAPVEWHQDWAFYPHTNDDILAIGVMLDDVDEDNGPMLAVPGTHKSEKIWDHHLDGYFCGAINPEGSQDLPFASSVACTGKAGSCSFHHVRLVHGSAQNLSKKPRHLLLYECAAADSWPLVNFKDLQEFDSRLLFGESTVTARTTQVPIRMPLPPALGQGSIYENQSAVKRRYFNIK